VRTGSELTVPVVGFFSSKLLLVIRLVPDGSGRRRVRRPARERYMLCRWNQGAARVVASLPGAARR
jgi:hypothetical protein